MLPNPQTREEIPVLCQEYQLTTNGDEFLVFDSGIGDRREFLYLHQILAFNFYTNVTIVTRMLLLRYALRYFTRFTLFMVNNAEEPFHMFMDSYLIKPRRLTSGFFRELFIRLENLGNRNPDDILIDFDRVVVNSIHNLNPQPLPGL